MIEDIIGYLGGILIVVSFIPQVIKTYRTKSVKDLSLWMLIATIFGSVFWLMYGILISSMPIIVMNSIFSIIVLCQLYLKLKYEK